MEQESKITWESSVESAEQMLSEQASQNEWLAELRKQLAENKDLAREMIGKMTDEEVVELADMCLDEMENREYSVLRLCVNKEKEDLPYMIGVVGHLETIASSLIYLGVKREQFAKCLKVAVLALEQKKDELEDIVNDMGDAEEGDADE